MSTLTPTPSEPQADFDFDFTGSLSPLPIEQLEAHARQSAAAHKIARGRGPSRELLAHLERNGETLERVYAELSKGEAAGQDETSSEEWLRDNHYIVRAQLQEIERSLPRRYYEELPTLQDGRWRRYPRVYVLAREFVAHTAGRFDQESLRRFTEAYQEIATLSIGELWAIPIMLRIALVDGLCALASQTLRAKQEREAARKFAASLLAGTEKFKTPLQLAARASSTFMVEIIRSLRDQSVASTAAWRWLHAKLTASGQSSDEVLRGEQQREAIDQLSIANIIGSMRALSSLDWPVFVESVSRVERILRTDPAGAYAGMDLPTRDRYRKSVEQLSRRSGAEEEKVAERAIRMAALAREASPDADRTHHVGYYLISRGRFELEQAMGYVPTPNERLARLVFRHPALVYLGGFAGVTALLESVLLRYAHHHGASTALLLVVLAATLLPVSELALGVLNTLFTSIIPPRSLPKLELRHGVPEALRTLVAVPAILSSDRQIREMAEALEVRMLANRDDNISFALLSDYADAGEASLPGDAALANLAVQLIEGLNARYGDDRFYLLHRRRVWNPSEQCWMGWERKRGKLHELNRLLRGATDTTFDLRVGALDRLPTMKYVITLDADTDLPLDAGRQLVGAISHPLNRPRFDPQTQCVREGYGILQPRVAISAVSAARTDFSQIFSGHVGLDPYTTAVSDIYQDLFHEGNYVGKGIYDVDAFESALAGRVPENTLLSHDLFEGLFARVALCTDIEVIDDYPGHYLTWVDRLHRWVRGDWQLLPWLGFRAPAGARGNGLSAIARWKIVDNLRRSLLAPALVCLLIAGWFVLPGGPGVWTTTSFLVLFFPAYIRWGQTFTSRIPGVSFRDHLRAERENLASSLEQALLWSAFLAHQSLVMLHAVGCTLVRLTITKRRLLEWVTAADAAAKLETDGHRVLRRMWAAPALAAGLGAGVLAFAPGSAAWALPVAALWAVSPLLAYRTGLRREERGADLAEQERLELRRVARLTWLFFEELIGPEDQWLIPDNYQEGRPDPIAHRTSPTNVGLQLLATIAAWDFGYLSASQCLHRLEMTCGTLEKLPRYRGHLFNWYDTQTLQPLAPLYVSTVDSGNFLGYLLTMKAALPQILERRTGPDDRYRQALVDTLDLFERDATAVVSQQGRESMRELRANMRRLRDGLSEAPDTHEAWFRWLRRMLDELSLLSSRLRAARDRPVAIVENPAALSAASRWIESAKTLVTAALHDLMLSEQEQSALKGVAEHIAAVAERFIDETELDFLFDPERQLFAIGYNVTEGRRDQSYYDTLASEARLASFIAIATRRVRQEHWFKLSRAMTQSGAGRALVSWSASMFEYLMPLLVMRTYPHTLLDETYEAVIDRQIEYARGAGVPWGISESAYNIQDIGSNYQYRAFGVPGLGLKRGLADDLVIAPYATMLAAPIRPKEALANLAHLSGEGALGRMGFYEAIDYTPERVPPGSGRGAVVKTYMAHHHAMSLVALDNCLHRNVMRERFHAEPRVQAAELLLQERSPHLVPLEQPPEEHKVEEPLGRTPHLAARHYVTPHTITPRAHLLSNGAYSVMVTNAGSGYSRWRDLAVTRWREDVTTDGWGGFVYVRDVESGDFWSAGYHPSGVKPEHYEVTFAPDRAVFRRRDQRVETLTEITVSPEDDAEIRRVSVTNHSRITREIELTSYAEVVLAPQAADLAHPAFSNLFVESAAVPDYDAVVCSRRPRAHETRLFLGHVLSNADGTAGRVEFETDRERFVGRGRTTESPAAMASDGVLSGSTGAVLDPIVSLRVRLRVAPGATARVAFATVVAENEDGVHALVEKYHDPYVIARAFELASTHSEIERRHLGITREDETRFQRLGGRVIYGDPRLRSAEAIARNNGAQPDLWKFGISGDLPIVLVSIGDAAETALAQEMIRAQEFLRVRGFRLDLVILNEIPASYRQDVQDELQRMMEAGAPAWMDKPGGVFLRRGDTMSEQDRVLLRAVARAVLDGSRGRLEQQLKRTLLPPVSPPLLDTTARNPWRALFQSPAPASRSGDAAALLFFNGLGGFTKDGREYVVAGVPPTPWSNVVANARFGFVATESSLGCTWSGNSYQNRLTPWSNDPVVDPAGEALFLRDEETGEYWSATPAPAGRHIAHRSRFGSGYVAYEHEHDGLQVELLAFVPAEDPVKVLRLRVRNASGESRKLSATYYVDWCLGDNKTRAAGQIVTMEDPLSGALFARNAFRVRFGERVAFVNTSSVHRFVTGDRMDFIGRNQTLERPAALKLTHLSGRTGSGLDACGAVQVRMSLDAGATAETIFLLGDAPDLASARTLATRYRDAAVVDAEFGRAVHRWDERLRAVEVRTPDPALDLLMNRWLEYQVLGCRVHARSAFYQSGGAYGFRDQLQDVLALLHFDPAIARAQILRAASRQFPEGDVQHWWHEPGGEGVRTRIQDDRLWLVYAALEYARVTGDWKIFDETVSFIEQRAPAPDEHSVYEVPVTLPLVSSLYDHCARAVAATLPTGVHGLPYIGTGDWNDGMDEVGARGQGESVWLGWFLAALLPPFADLAEKRGDAQQAALYRESAQRLVRAIEQSWDGAWYRRAYFDDGTPLGSQANEECKIDAIAQAWAVIAGSGDPERARRALAAVDTHLVDETTRLVMLLTPPFDKAKPSPGYIRGYVPGVRENGGQYTHAALWVVLAHALLGNGDRAGELLRFVNPVHRSADSESLARYRVEPYVIAADIYSAAGHEGRGGWTWYTGAAGWLYRIVLQHMLGIVREGNVLRVEPCIPRSWRGYQVTLRVDGTEYRIAVENPQSVNRGVASLALDGQDLPERRITLKPNDGTKDVRIVLGPKS